MARHLDANRERFWRQHVDRQRRSGLSIGRYCHRHRLAQSTFYLWQRKIADCDAAATASAPAPEFVPVTVIDSVLPVKSAIDIRLANGRRVRVRSGCDRELLAAVLALLEGQPC